MQSESPKYKTQGDFSKAAFPNEPNHAKIWQAIKQGQKNSPPRKVSIEDACSMANAVGETLERLLIRADMRIQDGWTLEQDIFFSPEAKLPGRPKKAQKLTPPSKVQDNTLDANLN